MSGGWTGSRGGPGDVLALSVSGLIAAGDPQKRGATRFYVYGQTTASNGTLVEAPVVSADAAAGAVSIQLPGNLPAGSTYLVWAANTVGDGPTPTTTVYSPAVAVNAPIVTWGMVQPVTSDAAGSDVEYGVTPSYELSLFSTNLDQDSESAAADAAAGFGDASWVYLQPMAGGSPDGPLLGPIKATPAAAAGDGSGALDVNPYKVDLVLTNSSGNVLPAGTTSVVAYVSDGHGGGLGVNTGVTVNVPAAATQAAVPPAVDLDDALAARAAAGQTNQNAEYFSNQSSGGVTYHVVNQNAITDAANYLYATYVSTHEYASVTLALPAGVVDLAVSFVPHDDIHYLGAGNSTYPIYGTIFEPAATDVSGNLFDSQSLIYCDDQSSTGPAVNVAFSNLVIRSNNPALTGSQILSTLLDSASPEYLTSVVRYNGHALSDEFDNVTIDGRLDPTGVETAQVATEISVSASADNVFVTNSTFYGSGVNVGGFSQYDSFDNCTFHASGASASQLSEITLGAFDNHMSVTRCVVEAAVDDRTVQTGNSDYDSATRPFWADGSIGYLYVGDNTSRQLYPVPETTEGSLNGGEPVLVEAIQHDQPSDGAVSYNGGTAVALASALGITAFGGGSFAITGTTPFYNLNRNQTIAVLSGPGAGQWRYITNNSLPVNGVVTYTLDRPWDVVPDPSQSTVTVGNVPVNVAVYQNTLNGDGLRSTFPMSHAAGIAVPGSGVVEDDNDVSNVPYGLDVGASSPLGVNSFNLYARNSLHGNGYGVRYDAGRDNTEATPNPTAVGADAAYAIGGVFRNDAVSGTAGTGFLVVSNLYCAQSQVRTDMLLPVFDHCQVSGARYAFAFDCPSARNGSGGVMDPGIAAATLVDCFASGPGTPGSAAVTRRGDPDNAAADGADAGLLAIAPLAIAPLGTDRFQGFDYDYVGPVPPATP